MMDLISLLQTLGSRRLQRDAREYAAGLRTTLPKQQRREQRVEGAFLTIGRTLDGNPFKLPLADFSGHGLIAGATGSGKTWAAVSLMQQMGAQEGHPNSFGVIDAKGDLAARAVLALGDQIAETAVILDFSRPEPMPFGLLLPQGGESPIKLVDRRMEVFDDVLGRDNQLSLRMSRMLRNVMLTAGEQGVTFPLIEFLLANPDVCRELGSRSADDRTSTYFQNEFDRERNTTVPALLARLDFLLRNPTLRLSLAARERVDLAAAMDNGVPVIVSTGGPRLPRQAAGVIQSLVLSDVRQATFARARTTRPYTWWLDEAQTLMVRTADTGNLIDILTMSRSFGVGVVLLTQSALAASPDRAFIRQLETNTKWVVIFRSGPDDARFIEPGVKTTGRIIKARDSNGRPSYLTSSEEAQEVVQRIASLPAHEAYVWVRTSHHPAARVRFPRVNLNFHRGENSIHPSTPTVDAEAVCRDLGEQEELLRQRAGSVSGGRANRGASLGVIIHKLDEALKSRDAAT